MRGPVLGGVLILPYEWNTLETAGFIGLWLFIAVLLYTELNGYHFNYSKFAVANVGIPSRVAMFMIYFGSFALGAAALGVDSRLALLPPSLVGLDEVTLPERVRLVSILMTIHFGKRLLEVLFVHRYSGTVGVTSTVGVSVCYLSGSVVQLWSGLQVKEEDVSDAIYLPGIALFFLGTYINFEHHIRLRNLRKPGEKKYVVPRGGLFEYVTCPHYFGEIVMWAGATLLVQHYLAWQLLLLIIAYLAQRSYRTMKWYHEKLEDYPRDRRCLVPFIW